MAVMTALFLVVGNAIAGTTGMVIAGVVALGMNVYSYWNSDKIVLKAYKARPIDGEYGWLDDCITNLSQKAGIPRPKSYLIDSPQPNAFATGRNPQNGAVAITTGLLEMLTKNETAGVIAHELAHIKNRDTLTMTITATISGALGMLSRFGGMMGRGRGMQQRRGGGIGSMLAMMLAPLAAMFVQMAISRTREYEADKVGVEISGKPLALASALAKISRIAPQIPNHVAMQKPETAHLFIFNPLRFGGLKSLFSTHPDPKKRIAKLREYAADMGRLDSRSFKQDNPWVN